MDLSSVLEGITDDGERTVLKLLVDEGGSLFQSDLVEESGFSKSKVSLILDRLEARGMLERRRSGMTNLVKINEKYYL